MFRTALYQPTQAYSSVISKIAILFLALSITTASSEANSNTIRVRVNGSVVIDVPENWTVFSDNQRLKLSEYVDSQISDNPAADLNFAANYYFHDAAIAAVNTRFYPYQTITQKEVQAFSAIEIKELDLQIREGISKSLQPTGLTILTWFDTRRMEINGISVLLSEYRRSHPADFVYVVRLVRVLDAHQSFTLTVSYREDYEKSLRPVADKIILSLKN